MADMQINMLFGFLGSGKTTLVRRLLSERQDDRRMAVIVNEFGDVGIDGAILEGGNIDMIELTSGCLCCTLKGSLLEAVEELRDDAKAEHVVIEATGIAKPEEIMETFSDSSLRDVYQMAPFVTVIDASKFLRLQDVLGEFYIDQVKNADLLLLNKVDLVSGGDLEALREKVHDLNPFATIHFTERCDLDVSSILDGAASSAMARFLGQGGDDISDHDHDHRHAPAHSFVLDASAGARRSELADFFAAAPEDLWRAKGFMIVDGEPALIQVAMGELEITRTEPRAHYHLVFIGRDLDQTDFRARFAEAIGRGSNENQG